MTQEAAPAVSDAMASAATHVHPHGPSAGADGQGDRQVYAWATALTLVFAVVEAAGGLWTGSLALLSDAGHMFSDVLALLVAWVASILAQRPSSSRHSFGLVRAEVLGSVLNGLLMLAVIGLIAHSAIVRLQDPVPIDGLWTLLIAVGGLVVNAVVILLLSRTRHTLNSRGALLHVIGDLLGSFAALASGLVVLATGWMAADPLLSVVIAALILVSTVKLLNRALHVLLEGVPEWVDLDRLRADLAAQPGVAAILDSRAWVVGSGQAAFTARVQLTPGADWAAVLDTLEQLLVARYAIDRVTLQPVPAGSQGRGH